MRPPIIISNGGIASELTRNLRPAQGETRTAVEIIVDNVKELNNRITDANPHKQPIPVARTLRGGGNPTGKNEEKIYWRLEIDRPHRREIGLDAR